MKNWLPLEFFPELHMATCGAVCHAREVKRRRAPLTTPRSVNFCRSPAFSSLNVPPQMLCRHGSSHASNNALGTSARESASNLAAAAVLKYKITALVNDWGW
jgi:hypothetical protein